MAVKNLLESLVFLTVICVCVLANTKYDRKINRPDARQQADIDQNSPFGKEFKSRRVIQAWQKAQRMDLAGEKMKELHRELMRVDSAYHKLKKEAGKPDVSNNIVQGKADAEMVVEKHLGDIMRRYGMGGPAGKTERVKDALMKDSPFEDRKVAQLWHKAQKSKMFSEEELKELKEELSLHEQKVREFNSLMNEVHGEDGQKSRSKSKFNGKDPEEMRSMRVQEMELKKKHRQMAQEYEQLSVKTIPKEERGSFTERRVITLWQEARNQDFTPEDLAAIEKELKDFERRILEHNQLHLESMDAEIELRSKSKDPKVAKMQNTKQKSLYDRAKELGIGVHNRMKELRDRISQGGKWNEEL